MSRSKVAIGGAVAALALLVGAGVADAQSQPAQQGRVIEVPPGAVVLVLPSGTMPVGLPMFGGPMFASPTVAGPTFPGPTFDAAFPMPAMPAPDALFREVDQMMAQAQSMFASPFFAHPEQTIQAALRQGGGPVSGMMVTSFSDGHGVCTKQVTWSGNGAAPKVNISATGDACGPAGHPAAAPQQPLPAARLVQASYRVPTLASN